MKGYLRLLLLSISVFAVSIFSFSPFTVHAVDLQGQINAQLGGATTKAEVGAPVDPREATAALVSVFLSILGTVFLILIILSGYWLVTARGEEEKIERAQKTVRSAIIGLIIVLLAYAITIFVSARIVAVSGAPSTSASRPAGCNVWGASWFRPECR